MRWLTTALPLVVLIVLAGNTWGRAKARTAESPVRLAAYTATADPNRCASCHALDPMLSHPVNVRPTMVVPSGLPLDEGRITCTTCHTEGGLEAHAQATARHDGMLRADSETLCAMCHSGGAADARSMHAAGLGRAHLQSSQGSGTTAPDVLDAESRRCLACHDGAIATDITGGMAGSADSIANERNHPVGVVYGNRLRYEAGIPRKSDMPVVAASDLPSRIRLFEGQVGCGSCHSLYSSNTKYLAIDNDRSRLCLSCHGGWR